MSAFCLDPRLNADCHFVGDLPLSRLLLMNDARWPWLILVPRLPDLREIIDLEGEDRVTLMEEIADASFALKGMTGAYKINVAALGNLVDQLHIHVIGRFTSDPAWPQPVFGFGDRIAYGDESVRGFIECIQTKFGLPATPKP